MQRGLKVHAVQNKVDTEQFDIGCGTDNSKKIESLLEISNRLSQMGYTLDLFDEKDEKGLYRYISRSC